MTYVAYFNSPMNQVTASSMSLYICMPHTVTYCFQIEGEVLNGFFSQAVYLMITDTNPKTLQLKIPSEDQGLPTDSGLEVSETV